MIEWGRGPNSGEPKDEAKNGGKRLRRGPQQVKRPAVIDNLAQQSLPMSGVHFLPLLQVNLHDPRFNPDRAPAQARSGTADHLVGLCWR